MGVQTSKLLIFKTPTVYKQAFPIFDFTLPSFLYHSIHISHLENSNPIQSFIEPKDVDYSDKKSCIFSGVMVLNSASG